MTVIQDIDQDKVNAEQAVALYQQSLAAITSDWPDLSNLPANAQTALEALRLNQRRLLWLVKYLYQRNNS